MHRQRQQVPPPPGAGAGAGRVAPQPPVKKQGAPLVRAQPPSSLGGPAVVRGRGIAASLGQYAQGYPIVHEGETYYLVPLSEANRAALEQWARKRAFGIVALTKGVLDPEDYQEQLSRLVREVERGDYSFANPHFVEKLETFEGGMEVLRQMMAVRHPDITTEFVEQFLIAHSDEISYAQLVLHPDIDPEKRREILARLGRTDPNNAGGNEEGPEGNAGGGGPSPSPA